MKQYLSMVLFLLSTFQLALGQVREITGIVTSAEDGNPLPGVNVLVKNTNKGGVTGLDGRYRLSLEGQESTLVFSFIGYQTAEYDVANQTVLNVILQPDSKKLREVVVIGYGTMNRSTLPSAVSTVGKEQLEKDPLPSVMQALQGKAGGVQVTQNSGTPGGGLSIRVRGTTSINASAEPLYVIDGVPVNNTTNFVGGQNFDFGGIDQGINVLASLNPGDIESVEVLKDAAASAIYGARAANGVVLITTKRGSANKSTINLNAYVGVQEVPRERWLPFMNTSQYIDYMRDLYGYLGQTPPPSILRDDVDINWQEEVFRRAPIQNYELSASGGSDKTRYYTSMGFYNQQGTIINSGFKRYSGRLNVDHEHSERLKFSINLNVTQAVNDRIQEENSRFATIRNGLTAPPNNPIFNPDGSYFFDPVVTNRENTVAWLELLQNRAETFRVLGNASADYTIVKGLTFKTNWGFDISDIQERFILPPNGVRYLAGIGEAIARNSKDRMWLNENILTFDKKISDHYINVLGGVSFQESNFNFVDARRRNFPTNNIGSLIQGGLIQNALSSVQEWSIMSAFARLNYTYKDKYLFNVNFRRDGSSRFGANTKFGNFPSIALGWRVSEEAFMQNLSFINNLKLRGSWGLTGNQEIPNYASFLLYSSGFSYLNQPGFVPNAFGDPDLTWETTRQTNIGIDLGFFNNRVSVLADYYIKNTSGLLNLVQVPRTSGYTSVFKNLGEIQNKGFEFELTTQNLVGEFRWTTSLNMTFNRNRVISLPEGDLLGGIGNFNIAREGLPLGSFLGWRVLDVNPANGMIRFQRGDMPEGGPPARQEDRQIIGDPNPRVFGGITNNFFFKGFELSIMGQFVYGIDLYNYTAFYRLVGTNLSGNGDVAWTRRWRQPGDITDVPRPTPGSFDNAAVSTRWVEDGSFFRIRNVTLSYNIPAAVTQKLKVSGMRVYTTVQNALLFTNYSGYDPEVNALSSDGIAYGTDHSNYPQPRMYTAGLQLSF
jgi:TonB-linked SusC/RagA family outer membrane protein